MSNPKDADRIVYDNETNEITIFGKHSGGLSRIFVNYWRSNVNKKFYCSEVGKDLFTDSMKEQSQHHKDWLHGKFSVTPRGNFRTRCCSDIPGSAFRYQYNRSDHELKYKPDYLKEGYIHRFSRILRWK